MAASDRRARLREQLDRLRTPQLSVAVFVVCVGLLLNVEPLVLTLVDAADAGEVVGAVLAVALLVLAYSQVTWPLVFGGLGQRRLVLRATAYAFGVGVLCLALGPHWFDMAFLPVALLFTCLPVGAALAGAAASIATVVWGALRFGSEVGEAAQLAVHTVLLAAVFYVLLRLATMLRYVEAGREAAERAAIVEERVRLGRDLHDVAVHHFTAIRLKAEIATRLYDAEPPRARRELVEIADASVQGLSRVRSLIHGYRHSGFGRTLAEAANLLQTAGVELRSELEVRPEQLPEVTEQVLCWVLTEGVTNALRHSSPTVVIVRLDARDGRTSLQVSNDGVLPTAPGGRRGHGLAGLSERLEAVGGTMSSVRTADDRFTVTASVPGEVCR
ncbi:hypothetical protein GTR02_14345 [Kineococcus sp. R8]|uniref:sensor histidine kinase n=1 Tax=Kineococcus siccus TaxID=2696567 RepID=UPI001412D734|nr:histidine kinase [Kineococcus siccus]NAZ82996.1 hypothetical protein [Kineococcus siccus]